MSAFLDFFEQMPVWMKAGWVVLCIAIFWILEGNYSLLTKPYSKWKHARTNLSLLVFVLCALFGGMMLVTLLLANSSG